MPKNPGPLRFLAIAYAELGREQEAKEIIKPVIESGGSLRKLMNLFPKKDPELRERIANALLEAGLPGEPGGYFKILHDKRLSDKEIKELVFGHIVEGIDSKTGKEWQINRTTDRKATYQSGESSDPGKSWIENNMLCNQWEKLYGGIKDCMPVFKNPDPRPGKKEEYLATTVYGFSLFSVVD